MGERQVGTFRLRARLILARHLRGRTAAQSPGSPFVVGVYPLLSDDTCWFLVVHFDDDQWAPDALAFVETCRGHGIAAALERSRSGNGGHMWIFFAEPIPARDAGPLRGVCPPVPGRERRTSAGVTGRRQRTALGTQTVLFKGSQFFTDGDLGYNAPTYNVAPATSGS